MKNCLFEALTCIIPVSICLVLEMIKTSEVVSLKK